MTPIGKCGCVSSRGWTVENKLKAIIPAALAAIALAVAFILILHRQGIMTSPLTACGGTGVFVSLGAAGLCAITSVAISLAVKEKKAKADAKVTFTPITPKPPVNPLLQSNNSKMSDADKRKKGLNSEGIFTTPKTWDAMLWVKETWREISERIQPNQFWIVPGKEYFMLAIKQNQEEPKKIYCRNLEAANAQVAKYQNLTDGSLEFKRTHFHTCEVFETYSSYYLKDSSYICKNLLKENTYWIINYNAIEFVDNGKAKTLPACTLVIYKANGKDYKFFYKVGITEPQIRKDFESIKLSHLKNGYEEWKKSAGHLSKAEGKELLQHHSVKKEEIKQSIMKLSYGEFDEKTFDKQHPPLYCLMVGRVKDTPRASRISGILDKQSEPSVYYFNSSEALAEKKSEIADSLAL